MFLDLPVDIKLEICASLSPEDVLALKQTCRVLHALGCLDYVWHQMTVDLPLDLPLNRDIKTLSSSEVQLAVIKALRLERNWQGYPGRPRQLHRVQHDEAVVNQMQPLGSEWLVTLSRVHLQATFQLSIWSLKDGTCYRVAELHSASRFSAALHSESKGVVAVIGYGGSQIEYLNIYSVSLPHRRGAECMTRLCRSISRPKTHGTFFDVQVRGDIVAAGVARFLNLVPSYEIFFFNVTSNIHWSFHPRIPSTIEQLRFRVFPDRVVLVGVKQRNTLVISVYTLPSVNREERSTTTTLKVDDSPILISHYETTPTPKMFDFHIPTDPTTGASGLFSIMIFPDLLHNKGEGYTLNFSLGPLTGQTQAGLTVQSFRTRAKTSVDIVCVGTTGKRAVWLQRRWDTDEFELMRGSFPSAGTPKVQALFPRHMALPFEAHSCVSLAFDEATGRVYLSLHTGGLYIVDL